MMAKLNFQQPSKIILIFCFGTQLLSMMETVVLLNIFLRIH